MNDYEKDALNRLNVLEKDNDILSEKVRVLRARVHDLEDYIRASFAAAIAMVGRDSSYNFRD